MTTDQIEVDQLGFNPKSIFFICVIFAFLDININLDHGALPSAGTSIKEDLDLPNATFGSLGSMVFLGLVMGSFIAPVVFSKLSYKTIITLSFVFNGLGIFGFIMVSNFYIICFFRLLSGFAQIFLTIYIPIYCDCFGTKKLKPYMMSLILLAAPLGVTMGYGMSGILVSKGYSWRMPFLVIGIIMGFSAVIV